MCDCGEDTPGEDGARIALTPAMVRRMRSLEQTLAGERVPARVWDVFLGRESGGIAFAQMLRLQQCRQRAVDEERRARRMFVRARARAPARGASVPVCLPPGEGP